MAERKVTESEKKWRNPLVAGCEVVPEGGRLLPQRLPAFPPPRDVGEADSFLGQEEVSERKGRSGGEEAVLVQPPQQVPLFSVGGQQSSSTQLLPVTLHPPPPSADPAPPSSRSLFPSTTLFTPTLSGPPPTLFDPSPLVSGLPPQLYNPSPSVSATFPTAGFAPSTTVSGRPPAVFTPPSTVSAPPTTVFNPPPSISGPPSAVFNPPPSIPGPPSAVFNLPPSVSGPPSAVFNPPPSISGPPSAVFNPPPSVSGPPPTVFKSPPSIAGPPSTVFNPPPSVAGPPPTVLNPPPSVSGAGPSRYNPPPTVAGVPPTLFAPPPSASAPPRPVAGSSPVVSAPPPTLVGPPPSAFPPPPTKVTAPPPTVSAPPSKPGAPPVSEFPPRFSPVPISSGNLCETSLPQITPHFVAPVVSSSHSGYRSTSPTAPAPYYPPSEPAPPPPLTPYQGRPAAAPSSLASPSPPAYFTPTSPVASEPPPPQNTPSQDQASASPVSPHDLSSRLQYTADHALLNDRPPLLPPPPASNSAPPPKGAVKPSYRLRDVKKVAYAAVPDLGVMPPPELVRTSPPPSSPPPVLASPPAFTPTVQGMMYRPVYHHWFVKKESNWEPFSMADSLNLEQAFTSCEVNEETVIATDGGRYDVEVAARRRVAAYWEEPPGEVRRCSWFVRGPANSTFLPYDENIATLLEDEYKSAMQENEWNRRVELSDGEVIILHGPSAIAHHQRSSSPDPWGNPPAMQFKPRVVKRGLDEFDIPEGEPSQVDHLLLVVHGIGKVCDLRFRSLVQVVDDFRNVSLGLITSHFKSSCELGLVGRVEILPVEWHRALHTEAIDTRLSDITLPSIPRAREFTNETLLDILFYTSPVFCERIVQAVGAELNRVYSLYTERNPGFRGGVSLGGHSLGSLILFDTLCHQRPPHKPHKQHVVPQDDDLLEEDLPEAGHLGCLKAKARLSRRMSYLTIGSAGTGQPYIMYPQLLFQPKAFFALGSPIGMFVTVRGVEALGEEFKFPTCPGFFNIFHPNDPVAYRIEPLIMPDMAHVPAVLIPHHKGRKRMHLELKETMAHVTAALKQKILDSVRNTWNTVYQLAAFHKPTQAIENEVDKVLESELEEAGRRGAEGGGGEGAGLDLKVGCLNTGRRIDYVLQEAPLETFNQYISAVRSHVVYWESEDTMLMILKELYQTVGISADSQVPQPILPFDISSEDFADPGRAYAHYTESPSS